MTVLWRIAAVASLQGRGAERANGRWHTAASGRRLLYLSEHPAVALIETLVNLQFDAADWPMPAALLRVHAARAVRVGELTERRLPAGWRDDPAATRALGDRWLSRGETALLRVPSAPAPESHNFLFNPLHPQARLVRILWQRPLHYDQRLFRLAVTAPGPH
ncbi:MAG: RES family NAD+ phosphorylase [Terriglobales bacterium]